MFDLCVRQVCLVFLSRKTPVFYVVSCRWHDVLFVCWTGVSCVPRLRHLCVGQVCPVLLLSHSCYQKVLLLFYLFVLLFFDVAPFFTSLPASHVAPFSPVYLLAMLHPLVLRGFPLIVVSEYLFPV